MGYIYIINIHKCTTLTYMIKDVYEEKERKKVKN